MEDNVVPVDFPQSYHKLQDLKEDLLDVIYNKHGEELAVVSIVGVLDLIKLELLNSCFIEE